MNEQNIFLADKEVIDFHQEVCNFPHFVNNEVVEKVNKNNNYQYPLTGGALRSITADSLCVHQAVFSLCKDGWAFIAPNLLRTLIDLFINSIVLTRMELNSEYMAFKWGNFGKKALLVDKDVAETIKIKLKEEIDNGISKLSLENQKKAKDFIFKGSHQYFFYCPEFSRPEDVIDKICHKRFKFMFKKFSSTIHGSFIGLSIFKDNCDDIHTNPRPDKNSQNRALYISSRLLLEINQIRWEFEMQDSNPIFDMLLSKFNKLKIFFNL